MNKFLIIIISLFVTILFLNMPVSASNVLSIEEINLNQTENYIINRDITIISDDDGIVAADLEIKAPGGDWTDNSVTASVGDTIEFKVYIEISRPYFWFGGVVELPSVNNENMFNNIRSVSPKPLPPIGIYRVEDDEVSWIWFGIDQSSWSKTMSFKATIAKKGTQNIELVVGGNYSDNGQSKEGMETDSIRIIVNTAKNKQKNFVDKDFIKNKFYYLIKIVNANLRKLFNLVSILIDNNNLLYK